MPLGLPFAVPSPVINRMPANPFDKTTLVSLVPKDIDEVKHTLFPGRFIITKADWHDEVKGFTTLVVGPSSWFKEMEEGQPYLEIPTNSLNIADSIIKDYCNGLVGCNMHDKMPGLFYVPGAVTKETILEKHGKDLAQAKVKQVNWMREVVKLADILWARTQGNPLAISDDARLFAEILGQKDKPWMGDFKAAQLSNCPACGEMINLVYPVCKHCKHVHDKKKAKEMGIVFAEN